MVTKTEKISKIGTDYKVADISLAEFGKKEIKILPMFMIFNPFWHVINNFLETRGRGHYMAKKEGFTCFISPI